MAGYPVANIKPGMQTITTEADGPSNSNDYYRNGLAITLDGVNPVPPNTPIPPGAKLQVYAPQGWDPQKATAGTYAGQNVGGWNTTGGGGVGTVVTGTQIPLDAAQRDNIDANTAQAYAAIDQARQQYQLDVARFGEDVAARIFNQRVQNATLKLNGFNANLNRAGVQLQANQQGYDQRAGVADRKTAILGMLADRSGPQDWVKYTNLLNGLSAPSGQTTHFEPFSILDGLIQPGRVDIPDAVNVGEIPIAGPTTVNAPQPQPQPQGQGQGPSWAATATPANGGVLPSNQDDNSLVLMKENAPNTASRYTPLPAPAGEMSAAEQAARQIAAQRQQQPAAANPASFGSPIGRFANGGTIAGGGMAITGDSPKGHRTGYEEMVINLNPDPEDRVLIVPLRGRAMPDLPRAAGGGVYGATGGYDFTKYSPQTLGNLPFMKKLSGQKVGGSFGGFGAPLGNADYGVSNAPWNISYQQLMQMKPSETDMAKGFYQDALWTDWRDVVENARRAAPIGTSFGATQYAA